MVYFEIFGAMGALDTSSGFNPCSNGWCTSSPLAERLWEYLRDVSILVLMDGVLREKQTIRFCQFSTEFQSLF